MSTSKQRGWSLRTRVISRIARSDFVVSRISVFTRLKHFHVEKQLKILTDNLKRDQAVVELCFDLVSDGDPALETLWTTTFVATVSFVTIDGGKHPTALWGKDFVAFEAELASEKFCNWIIMRRSVNLRSE